MLQNIRSTKKRLYGFIRSQLAKNSLIPIQRREEESKDKLPMGAKLLTNKETADRPAEKDRQTYENHTKEHK